MPKCSKVLEGHPKRVQRRPASGGKEGASLADLIVLGGCAAGIEKAAKPMPGTTVDGPLHPGRMDASAGGDRRRIVRLRLEPIADGFRNYLKTTKSPMSAEELLVDKASCSTLTAPEMTALVGGMRVLNTNAGQTKHGVLHRPTRISSPTTSSSTCWSMGTGLEGHVGRSTPTCSRAATASLGQAVEVDRHPRATWYSGPTPSCALWPRSTAAPIR